MKFGPPLSSVYRYQATDDAGRSWLLTSKPVENIPGKDDYNFWMIFCDGSLVWAKPGNAWTAQAAARRIEQQGTL